MQYMLYVSADTFVCSCLSSQWSPSSRVESGFKFMSISKVESEFVFKGPVMVLSSLVISIYGMLRFEFQQIARLPVKLGSPVLNAAKSGKAIEVVA